MRLLLLQSAELDAVNFCSQCSVDTSKEFLAQNIHNVWLITLRLLLPSHDTQSTAEWQCRDIDDAERVNTQLSHWVMSSVS